MSDGNGGDEGSFFDKNGKYFLFVGGLVAGLGLGAWLYNKNNKKSTGMTAQQLMEGAFPKAEDQPMEKVRQYFIDKHREGCVVGGEPLNITTLDFWLFLADQNMDNQISKEEFARMVKVGAFSRFGEDAWADDLRTMIFKVFDTDRDECVDLEELVAGLTKLYTNLHMNSAIARDQSLNLFKELGKEGNDSLCNEEWQMSSLAKELVQPKKLTPLFGTL